LRLILIKKYEKTYCSLDQFLCAMGALIWVFIFFFIGNIKNLGFVSFFISIKVK
jgi:hypothetical protein